MLPFAPSQLPPELQDPRVIAAMEAVPRERFVPAEVRHLASRDEALPIGGGQTISQPYLVAYMTAALRPEPGQRVLEIGTGSGYQTAVLARLGLEVYSVEVLPELSLRAKAVLEDLGLAARVHFRIGDGRHGWPGAAPFDALLCAAAAPSVPPAFLEQVRVGGRLVLPVGPSESQDLLILERTPTGVMRRGGIKVRFVPLVRGEASA